MDIESFRQGAIIGFAVAAPVGPIGVLVIQRSLESARIGLFTGLGAAAADGLYALGGAIATAYVQSLLASAWIMELVGAAVLAWLAARTWSERPKSVQGDGAFTTARDDSAPVARVSSIRLLRSFGETLFLTLANPATILSFAAVSASQGLGNRAHAYVFAGGVLIGSGAWWLLLSSGVRFGSRRLPPRVFQSLHVASGAVLATFAALAFVKAISDF